MIMAIIAVTAFLALTQVYLDKEAQNLDTRAQLTARLMTGKIARTISAVANAENSTTQTIVFGNQSSELGNYTICVNNSRVETLWGTKSIAIPIVAGRVMAGNAGLCFYACTDANRYNVTVQKVDGIIYLS